MIQYQGVWFPDDVGTKYQHAFKHLKSLEGSLRACTQSRTAVQAGGNIGLWPKRMAQQFAVVHTFEPEPISRACLMANVPANVLVHPTALGDADGQCSIVRQSLGSHQIRPGSGVTVTRLDGLCLDDVDLLQLDVEGYEWHALKGAEQTIDRCRPVIHLELRGFTEHYGRTDAQVRQLLSGWGYREHSQQPGNDVVFVWQRRH